MHFIFAICQWLEQTAVGTSMRESLWLFPIIETVHIFGIILLVGATSILDLRLMGLTFRDESVSKLAGRFCPGPGRASSFKSPRGFCCSPPRPPRCTGISDSRSRCC